MRFNNLAEMFVSNAERLPERTAYMYKHEGQYKSITFKQALSMMEAIAAGLHQLGVKRNDKISILSENRYEWAFTDYAILTLGAINTPIYPSLLPNQVEYLLKDSGAKIIFCSNQIQLAKVEACRAHCPAVEKIIVFDQLPSSPNYLHLEQLLKQGEEFLQKNPGFIKSEIEKTALNDQATIIYTSGTTGEPRGALLTHGNFLSNIEGSLQHLHVDENDVFLSFLPLCHIFERMAGHYLACYCSSIIAYAESIDTVAQNMEEVKPTVMTSVPRLYEKIYARVLENVENGPAVKRKIFYWSIGVGREYVGCVMNKKPISAYLKFKRDVAYKLVFSKLAERVGGRLRLFVSGGAPLAREIGEFFAAAGLMIYEGYGLTETSPVIAVNKEDRFRFGTVGPVIPGVEVKIADDGEILTRGPHIMLGYFNKENETREVIDEDKWFHTGDIGFIDNDGFLTITDRKKNIIVTSGGKNITPQPIENQLVTCKFIDQAMIIGDKRRYCTVLIVPAFETLEKWAKENSIPFESRRQLVMLPVVRQLFKNDIDNVNNGLASYETIKDFILTDAPFTIETGELTPSLKIKRKVVLEKFETEIDRMYQVLI
jgi:long-chain acyl-CoA synthetase